MQQFKDATGIEWDVELTIGAVARIRAATGLDLFEPTRPVGERLPGTTIMQALADPGEFWEFLWHLVRPQAEQRKVDAAQFGRVMGAPQLIEAQQKFALEWRDFFLGLRRPDAAEAITKQIEMREAAIQVFEAEMQNPDSPLPAMVSKAKEKMSKELKSLLGNWQGSLE